MESIQGPRLPRSVAAATKQQLEQMPPAATIAGTRYAVAFLGKPTTAADKRTAPEGEALLEMSAEHVLARTLPEAFHVDSHRSEETGVTVRLGCETMKAIAIANNQ